MMESPLRGEILSIISGDRNKNYVKFLLTILSLPKTRSFRIFNKRRYPSSPCMNSDKSTQANVNREGR